MAAAMDVRETIEELRAALAELESGEGLSRFVEGHGLQSRVFVFSWESEELSIDFVLPCERVLSDEEERALDALRVGSALRLAILLLSAAAEGRLLAEGAEGRTRRRATKGAATPMIPSAARARYWQTAASNA